jgi:hypothetical protein
MATTDLMIGIGAEYKGKPAFNKANKDVLGLGKGVQNLAKAYIGLQGAQKAFRYGQQSLKAFVADDKAARQLAQTVSNLGLAYEATNVENFIQGLEKTYAVADDLLRPAMAKLIQVTQSYTKSKEIMTTALNAAAGAGVDLGTAVTDLSQAYVGNLRGLRKYNLGLTQAELATKSFQEIQDLLNKTFTGQASLAAETYAGKMAALTIAANNAQEIIGKGLVDAISNAFGNGDIDKATTQIESMAQAVADIVAGLGTMTGWYSKLFRITSGLGLFDALAGKRNELKVKDTPYDPMSGNMPDMSPAALKNIMARQKADKEAAKRQKELAALAQKQTKAVKEQTALAKAKAVLDKANAVFNLDLIQNTAALQGKLTEDETLRLKLQREILLGNSDASAKLAQELLSVQIAAMMAASVDPFGNYAKSAIEAMKALQEVRNGLASLGAARIITGAEQLSIDAAEAERDLYNSDFASLDTQSYVDDIFSRNKTTGQRINVVVSMDPMAAAAGVTSAVIDNAANGNSNNYSPIFSWAGGF